MQYQFKVRIEKENKNNFKIKLIETNRTLYVDKEIFDQRIRQGMYQVIGEYEHQPAK